MPKPMTPAQRAEIRRLMAGSMRAYLDELTKRYLTQPTSADSRTLMLEALAEALTDLTRGEPAAIGVLATFAEELQDKENSR